MERRYKKYTRNKWTSSQKGKGGNKGREGKSGGGEKVEGGKKWRGRKSGGGEKVEGAKKGRCVPGVLVAAHTKRV